MCESKVSKSMSKPPSAKPWIMTGGLADWRSNSSDFARFYQQSLGHDRCHAMHEVAKLSLCIPSRIKLHAHLA
jgi:hypothetical protein